MNEEQIKEQESVQAEEAVAEESKTEYEAFMEAYAEASLRLALLMNGVAREKLTEAAKLAQAFTATGLTPEEAAEKAVQEYPHLKRASREVPKFSTQTGGSGDGFAAIRSIFAKR